MEYIKFECSHCGDTLKVDAVKSGRTGLCPHCRGRIHVPEESSESGGDDEAKSNATVSDESVDEQEETVEWFVALGDDSQGPFDGSQIRQMVSEGRIDVNCLILRDGMEDWQPLRAVEEFADYIPITDKVQAKEEDQVLPVDSKSSGVASSTHKQAVRTSPRRPAFLVFVVFYTVFGGLVCVTGGFLLFLIGVLGGEMAFEMGLHDTGDWAAFIGTQFIGIILFVWGMIGLVAAYGLWSSQRWGRLAGKIYYVLAALIGVFGFITNLVKGSPGAFGSFAGLMLCLVILIYLFGSAEVARITQKHLQRFFEADK